LSSISPAGVTVVVANITLIGLLPFFFFRPGRRTAGWVATAASFCVAPVLALAALAGVAGPALPATATRLTGLVGVLAAVASTFVIGVAVGSHRTPIALWHQAEDAPVEIVTWGAYRSVRHPLYSAFLAALVACLLVVPSLAMAVVVATGFVAIGLTARREERRLLASHLGAQYAAYMASAGRFLPHIGTAVVPVPAAGRAVVRS
jgi:protein-S-isoprenylcysteine O-methyltransferase Ste14